VIELPGIHVVAGALFKHAQVLIAQRPPGKHMAGGWEFPGGKLHVGEASLDGLKRELLEEIGVVVQQAEWLCECTHDYSDRRVRLELWLITEFTGVPSSQEDQALQWVDISALDGVAMLPADEPLVKALQARCETVRQ
jgi:8-oxo-dGTP diphosphatase